MKKEIRLMNVFIIVGFLCTLYWVEASPWGSQAIAQYNEGYGTFDMKVYDANSVEQVLGIMQQEGFRLSILYYIGDYLFILFFGGTQAMISQSLCGKWNKISYMKKKVHQVSMGAVVVRGIADFIENTMLVLTLYKYPMVHRGMIMSASICTQVKLWCIKLWLISILLVIILKGTEYIGRYRKER